MSFRGRLRLFFATIVIVPMAGVALAIVVLTGKGEKASADAVIAEGMRVALSVHQESRQRAEEALGRLARDDRFIAALARGRPDAARARMAALARNEGIASIELRRSSGKRVLRTGQSDGVAAVRAPLVLRSGGRLGTLSLAAMRARRYADRVAGLTDFEVAVFRGRRRLASTVGGLRQPPAGWSETSSVSEVGGREYRGRVASIREVEGAHLEIVVFRTAGSLSGDGGSARLVIIGILLAAIMLALGLSASVVRESVHLHERVERRAVTDPITMLGNRDAFEAALAREIERRWRHGTPFSLVYLDLDGFKGVNDEFGHPQGDAALASVASVLQSASRDIDEPFRMGGDEFTVVLPQTELDGAAEVAERMREAVEALRIRLATGDGDLQLTATFGVASIPNGIPEERSRSAASVIEAANTALRRAKRKGRNRVERA